MHDFLYTELLEVSKPAAKAHKMGLSYAGYGKWKNKAGKTVAKTVDDKLMPIGSGVYFTKAKLGKKSVKSKAAPKKVSAQASPASISKNDHKAIIKLRNATVDRLRHKMSSSQRKSFPWELTDSYLATIINSIAQTPKHTDMTRYWQSIPPGIFDIPTLLDFTRKVHNIVRPSQPTDSKAAASSAKSNSIVSKKHDYAQLIAQFPPDVQKSINFTLKGQKISEEIAPYLKRILAHAAKRADSTTHDNCWERTQAAIKDIPLEVFNNNGWIELLASSLYEALANHSDEKVQAKMFLNIVPPGAKVVQSPAGAAHVRDAIQKLIKYSKQPSKRATEIKSQARKHAEQWRLNEPKPEDMYRDGERVKVGRAEEALRNEIAGWVEEGVYAYKSRSQRKQTYKIIDNAIWRDKKHPPIVTGRDPIYRGMVLSNNKIKAFLKRFVSGTSVILPPSGFSANPKVAVGFATDELNEGRSAVLVRIFPKKGKLVGLHISQGRPKYSDEQEIIRPSRIKNKVLAVTATRSDHGPIFIVDLEETGQVSSKLVYEHSYMSNQSILDESSKDDETFVDIMGGPHRPANKSPDIDPMAGPHNPHLPKSGSNVPNMGSSNPMAGPHKSE